MSNLKESKPKTSLGFLFEIFITFFKIGAFTFGGGYAMLPLIEREIVTNKRWLDTGEIIDYLAVSQSLPGAVAINSSVFIGYKLAGRKGALSAACGVILPSFLVILLIAMFFTRFQEIPVIQAAFAGIRSGIVALISLAAYRVGKGSIKDGIELILAVAAAILVTFFNVHAIFAIIGGALLGILIHFISPGKIIKGKKENKQ